MNIPKISVLLALNSIDIFTDKAIKSIINQDFTDFEFIIITNNASLELKDKINDYACLDERIKLFHLPFSGLANALNVGLVYAKGQYVARMDSDDISSLDRFSNQIKYLIENPDISVLGCRAILIDENDDKIGDFPFYENDNSIRSVLPYRNPLLHPCLMIKKSLLYDLGGYKYGHMSEDHELFIRAARFPEVKFHNLNRVLFQYRRHSNQITSILNAEKNFYEICGFLFTEFLLTKNPKYILGMLIVNPSIRRLRFHTKKCFSFLFKKWR